MGDMFKENGALPWIFAKLTLTSTTLWLNPRYYFSSDNIQAPLKNE